MTGQAINGMGGIVRVVLAVCSAWVLVCGAEAETAPDADGPDRPNFLLITCEDMGPDLGCFGDPYAITPRLDALAEEGVRFTRVFATAPVCSPARTALFFSRYQASLGGSNHRSRPSVGEDLDGFAAVLRGAGYYTANGPKLDVNMAERNTITARAFDSKGGWWDEDRGDRPFMVIRNFDTSHQSRTSVWPREKYQREIRAKLSADEIHDPAGARVPPTTRIPRPCAQLARYADCVTLMDREVGDLLDRLERDGLADDTIVIFFSDHGAGLTGHKKIALARGTRVPMIVRVPEKWRHLLGDDADGFVRGGADDRLVSFVDIGPTLIALAGLEVPAVMHGVPFLGDGPGREYAFAARDRIDEDIDHVRMVTDGRWVYAQAYFPDRPWWTANGYSSASAIYQEMERGLAAGTLPPDAVRFMTEPRGGEMLFDLEADPLELRDVSGEAGNGARLARFRGALVDHMRETADLGLVPEGIVDRLADDPTALLHEHVLDMAGFSGMLGDTIVGPAFLAGDANEAVRYWAITALGSRDRMLDGAGRTRVIVAEALNDPSPAVRVAAVRALLAAPVEQGRAAEVLTEAVSAESYWDALLAAREGQVLGLVDEAFVAAVRAAAAKWDRYEIKQVAKAVERAWAGGEAVEP